MRSLVSVIMPAYNAENYIGEAIESVLCQTYDNLELIVVEDKSTDRTLDVVRAYKDKRIKLFCNDCNMGIAGATNKGIEESGGKYIALLDDDDIAEKDRLQIQVEYLESHPDIDILGGRNAWIDSNGKIFDYGKIPRNNPKYIKSMLLFHGVDFANGTAMIRKEFIEKNHLRYRNGCYGMQDLLFYAESSKVGNISTIANFLLRSRSHSTNASDWNRNHFKEERAKTYARFQRHSLQASGFRVSEDDLGVINKVLAEVDGRCDSIGELRRLHDIFSELLRQGKEMGIDYYDEMSHWLRVKFAEQIVIMNDFFTGTAREINKPEGGIRMRAKLEDKYEEFINKWNLGSPLPSANINVTIRNALTGFISSHAKVAIYGNGYHTSILMSDFIYEMKSIRHIVDSYAKQGEEGGGFTVISDKQMAQHGIDGVVISSFIYRDEIKRKLADEYPQIDYLDIYEELEKNGTALKSEYYSLNHPYYRYRVIHEYNRKLCECGKKEETYRELFREYFWMKDFKSAQEILARAYEECRKPNYLKMMDGVKEISDLMADTLRRITGGNVLMLCMDALRREDLFEKGMPRLAEFCARKGKIYTNAYAFSTSTFESLIPAYSENDDLRTGYYESNAVKKGGCRFISEAVKQGRYIYFDTDMCEFVQDSHIDRCSGFQTVSEKIWNFAVHADGKENGLFYMHVLYESHYSFPNPYTEGDLVCEGTAMLFDFLPKRGSCLRTDYTRQHDDALRYLDERLSAMLEQLSCRTVIFADHGTLMLPEGTQLADIKESAFAAGEEWLRIPLAVFSPETGTGTDGRLISLMRINDIVISLLQEKEFLHEGRDFIKAARSAIYNPDFKMLYKMRGYEQGLSAFEAFIFPDGHKLVVFADGNMELYLGRQDQRIADEQLINKHYEKIRHCITVQGDGRDGMLE